MALTLNVALLPAKTRCDWGWAAMVGPVGVTAAQLRPTCSSSAIMFVGCKELRWKKQKLATPLAISPVLAVLVSVAAGCRALSPKVEELGLIHINEVPPNT